MIIYAHSEDIFDGGVTFGRHRRVSDVAHLTIRRGTPIRTLASQIATAAANHRSIWLLILNAHGDPAQVHIGEGLNELTVWDLAPLRPYMTPGGRGVEIHACLVAAAVVYEQLGPRDVGLEFLRRLAHVLDCDVRASQHLQAGAEYNIFGYPRRGSDEVGEFEGDMVLVRPGGGYSVHPPGY